MAEFRVPLVPSQQAPTPRLSLGHFLVWIALCAVSLGVSHFIPSTRPAGAFAEFGSTAFWIVGSMANGLALGGYGACIAWWSKYEFPTFPGEFIWCAEGVHCTCLWFVSATIAVPDHRFEIVGPIWFLISPAAAAVVYAVAGMQMKQMPWWRRFCFVVAAVKAVSVLTLALAEDAFYYRAAMMDGTGLIVVALVAVAMKYRRQRGALPWTHWIGLAVFLARSAYEVGLVNWRYYI